MERMGRYELLRRIAAGGMAEVFLARTEGAAGFSKTCVVKRILPHLATNQEFVTMFLNEGQLCAQLAHPNVVQFYDLGLEDGAYFLAMEYVDGPTLRQLIRAAKAAGEQLPWAVAVKIVSQALEGLAYAHAFTDESGRPLDLIHRDISPHNILLGRSGTVKLADFGIAKAASIPSVTKTGQLKGKLRYMSPEQLHDAPMDARSDLFAVGITLYEALVGVRPFGGETDAEIMAAIMAAEPPRLADARPDAPAGLQAVLDRALQKDPQQRYPSASQMQSELEALLVREGAVVRGTELAELMARLTPPVPEEAPPPPAPEAELPPPTRAARPPSGASNSDLPIFVAQPGASRTEPDQAPLQRDTDPERAPLQRDTDPERAPLPREGGPTALDRAPLVRPIPEPAAPPEERPYLAFGLVAAALLLGAAFALHAARQEATPEITVVARPAPSLPSPALDAGPAVVAARTPQAATAVDAGAAEAKAEVDAGPYVPAEFADVTPPPDPAPPQPTPPQPAAKPHPGSRSGSSGPTQPSWLITPGRAVQRVAIDDDGLPPVPPDPGSGVSFAHGTGTLRVHIRPRALVSIDDHDYGMVRDLDTTLEAGQHLLHVWAVTGQNQSVQVQIQPGALKELNYNF